MSDIAPRSGGPPSRRSREQKAFRLVVTGGAAATVAVAGVVLAVVGILGWWLPILAIIVAAICGLLFRRTVN
ncbi:MAG: hypothetical protein M3550_00495 [Actinomycetota bacterium]|jgi:putative flippase GtrA|nr:hypothetical protein [Actinomycetota bacterium]